jgi:Cu(I)/Ag(I) efflux system membrane fusion protein
MSPSKRSAWMSGLTVGLFALVAVYFRAPLMDWFSVGSSGSQTPASAHSVAAPARHAFTSDHLATLREVFSGGEGLRVALSQDTVEPLRAHSTRIGVLLESLAGLDAPQTVKSAIERAATSTGSLTTAETAVVARIPYGELSEALFLLARADPRLQIGWRVFHCPMATGFPKWFQAPEQIENPYMGQGMLACGSASDWAPEKTAQPTTQPTQPIDGVAYYTCSMHPSVHQSSQGSCPICGMDLTPVTHEDLRTGDVLVDSVRRQRIGVRTQAVTKRSLTRPIRAVGELTWDESKVVDVTARVDGWVEGVRVARTGDPVKRNALLLRFYSPQLLATQRELLVAQAGSRLAESARERLSLWGMSGRAIQNMMTRGAPDKRVAIRSPMAGVVMDKKVNEGAHVRAGALLYRIVDPSHLWLVADVFEQDLPYVAVGQTVRVSLPHAQNQSRSGRVAYVYPAMARGTRTGRVRIELENPDGVLRPGMLANVTFKVELGQHIAVPSEAVIYTGPRRLVFVDKGEGRLRPVEIKVGVRAGDWTLVKDGLSKGDVVVTSGAFLLAAESRIRSAADYWEANDDAQ